MLADLRPLLRLEALRPMAELEEEDEALLAAAALDAMRLLGRARLQLA